MLWFEKVRKKSTGKKYGTMFYNVMY